MDQYKDLSEDDIRKAMEGMDLPYIKEIRPGLWKIHLPGGNDLYTGAAGAEAFIKALKNSFNEDKTL